MKRKMSSSHTLGKEKVDSLQLAGGSHAALVSWL